MLSEKNGKSQLTNFKLKLMIQPHNQTKPNKPTVMWNILQCKEDSGVTSKTTAYVGRKYFKNIKVSATRQEQWTEERY